MNESAAGRLLLKISGFKFLKKKIAAFKVRQEFYFNNIYCFLEILNLSYVFKKYKKPLKYGNV